MEHSHEQHSHHSQQQHHALIVNDFKKRVYITLIITIPILILSPMIQLFASVEISFTGDSYILFGLATFIFFYGGWPFLTGLVDEVKDKYPGMMTLIGFAIFIAYFYSALTVFGF